MFVKAMFMFFCVLVAAGCGPDDSAKEESYSQIRLENDSLNEIYQFYIRPEGSSDWGSDLIDDTKYLPAHSVNDFTVSNCDEYYEFRATTFLGAKTWTSTTPTFCECGKIVKFIITDN